MWENWNENNSINGWKKWNWQIRCNEPVSVEALHALDNGIINNCVKVLFARIGNSDNLAELDKLAKKLTSLPRQKSVSSGADKDMPRLLWKEGITAMTGISASYRVGIMLTIMVLSLQSEGKNTLKVFWALKEWSKIWGNVSKQSYVIGCG